MSLDAFPRHFAKTFPDLVGTRLVVALSGGADSVALLHLLRDPSLALDLHAVHVHHGVRGDEADADAEFCRELAAGLGIPFTLVRLTPPERPAEGREASWRRLRYGSLREMAREAGASAIATGHHRDDVAEGVLVQLLRGGGPRALAGIAARAPGGVIRPLLPWGREEIEAWLLARGLSWREDSSNASPEHLRNLVRHRVLPALEAVSPAVRRHLVELANRLARDESFLAEELARRAAWIDPWDPEGGVPLETLAALPPTLLGRWLHAQVERAGIGRATRRQVELLEALVHRGDPAAVTLAGRWRLRRARGRLWLEPPRPLPEYGLALEGAGPVELPIPGWSLRIVEDGHDPAARWRITVPAPSPLVVRSSRPGDRIGPANAPRPLARVLADFLPRHLRKAWPVVCSGDRIVCVPGAWTMVPAPGERRVTVEVRYR